MSDSGDPTELTEPTEALADPAGGPPTASGATPSSGVQVRLWWLALGALAFLLLGSALTYVGTKAADDGPDFGRIASLRQQAPSEGGPGRGGPMMPGGPGGPGGPGFRGGPGFEGGPGFDGRGGDRGDEEHDGDGGSDDDGTDEGTEDGPGGSGDEDTTTTTN